MFTAGAPKKRKRGINKIIKSMTKKNLLKIT
jgi:hypothetical protein